MSTIVFSPAPRPPRHVAARLAALATWSLFGFGVVFATFLVAPSVLGLSRFAVLSGSMQPTLRVGDLVVGRRVQADAIRPGDIVIFRDPEARSRLLTHRVIGIGAQGSTARVVTRGDANQKAERWSIPLDGTVGRVEFRVPKLGYVLTRTSGRASRLALIAVPALLLCLLELKRLWLPKRGRDAR